MDLLPSLGYFTLPVSLFCFLIVFVDMVSATGPPTPAKQEDWSPEDNKENEEPRYGGVILRKTPSREKSSEDNNPGSSHLERLRKTPVKSNASRSRSKAVKMKVVEGTVAEKTAFFDKLSRGSTPPMPTAEIPAHTPQARHRIAKPVLIPQEESPLSAPRGKSRGRGRQRAMKSRSRSPRRRGSQDSGATTRRNSPGRSMAQATRAKRASQSTPQRRTGRRGRGRMMPKDPDPDYNPLNDIEETGW